MGWRIKWKEFSARHGIDKAYAIPWPARRTSGNWVLDPVPLLKNRAEREAQDQDSGS